jgi:hypothetical protein
MIYVNHKDLLGLYVVVAFIMGGFGSGRWGLHSGKDTVEECLIIDMNRIDD